MRKWRKNGVSQTRRIPEALENQDILRRAKNYEIRYRGAAQRGKVHSVQRHHQRRCRERQLPLLHHRTQRGHGGRAR